MHRYVDPSATFNMKIILCMTALFLIGIVSLTQGSPPVTYGITAIEGSEGECLTTEQLNTARDNLQNDTRMLIRSSVLPGFINSPEAPACSCMEIFSGLPSGYYWIQSLNASNATLQYCDMSERCCDSQGGWMRVANLDMTDPNEQCPPGFSLVYQSGKRICGRPGEAGCVSTTFPVHGVEYSKVCGKVIGYQYYKPGAFFQFIYDRSLTIDDAYVNGVSLTHGHSPRNHIWTFANAESEFQFDYDTTQCPCSRNSHGPTRYVPPYIGQDYFCDSGTQGTTIPTLYTDDPLWDGQGCRHTSSCCIARNPPWFCRVLPESTSNDIELRLCGAAVAGGDSPIESAEIYIQ